MAIIGFIALLLIGGYFALLTIGMLIGGAIFGSHSKVSFLLLIPAAIAAWIFYYACSHAPFMISLVSQ